MKEHKDYINQMSEWKKARDFYTSEKAVHEAGELYFPRLSGQDDDGYDAYKKRAVLSMFFKKIVDIYKGMAIRKPISITEEDKIEDFILVATPNGRSLQSYVYDILNEFFITGRVGSLVDMDEEGNGPYLVKYKTEDIINWKRDDYGNLKMVILREWVEDDTDEFNTDLVERYRVLDYDEEGYYRQRLYDADDVFIRETYPLLNRERMTEIPFIIHGGIQVKPPFLTEIVDLNMHHYILSGDLHHGLHWVALPTPYIFGVSEDEVPTTIGPTEFIHGEDADASCGFLEFSGEGLDKIESRMKTIEETISNLAVNIIMNTYSKLTATQVKVDASSSTASLAGTLNDISDEFTILLGFAAKWMGIEGNFSVQINTDFISDTIDNQELDSLINAYMNGVISYDTLWKNMQKGEIADKNKTAEQELAEINIGQ